jgi:hypothetical protein
VIVVRVELWPGGDPRPLRQIAILGIVNLGSEGSGRYAYEARAEGRISKLSHLRSDGALILVARAIEALAEESQPDPLVGDLEELPIDNRRLAQERAAKPMAWMSDLVDEP